MYKVTFTMLVGLTVVLGLHAQERQHKDRDKADSKKKDSLSANEIIFTPTSASTYIVDLLNMDVLWKPGSDSLKVPLTRLINQYKEKYDSIENILAQTPYYAVNFRKVDTLRNDTLALRWLNDSTFIIDTLELGREPLFVQKTMVKKIIDSLVLKTEKLKTESNIGDSLVRIRDTIISEKDISLELIIDTAFLDSKNVHLYQIKNRRIVPNILPPRSKKNYHFLADGSKLIISEPVEVIVADRNSPFNIVPNEKVIDSLSAAVNTLLSYTNQRDSIPIYLTNIDGFSTPFWLTVEEDELHRFWVKNQKNDSVSIWMGNPDKRNIMLILEDDIHVERIEKETVDDIPFTMATPRIELTHIEPVKEIPEYWDYDFSSSFSLSQNYLSNWAKGGESSVSSILDIKGQATYTNKETKREWTSSGRLKYGSVVTKEYGLRNNTDLLEFDSKYNKELRNKIDFSALYYMKSQIAKGYNYPNDSVIISKFLNPLTFTIGVGLEYKPFKKSTVNFSPLSYKNTFVLDTTNIDQTNHGIDKDKRAKQEMGGQVLIKSELTLFDDLKINNSLRFFSNYLVKPENVDVEWEFNLEKQISLFFTVRLDIHMIYDDDIRFTKLNVNDEPILLPDGNEKKIPKLQYKQFLGLTFLVKL